MTLGNFWQSLKLLSFPIKTPPLAVEELISILELTLTQSSASSASTLSHQTEMEATALIDDILGLLGIISNSSNVRNSFEIHGPVLDLAKRLLSDNNAHLIISFEWKYIPFTYPQNHPSLPSFVIIGLPASEASNALVLPALGHELGHSLWRRDRCRDHFEPQINQGIIDAIKGPLRDAFNRIFRQFNITADQCEEYQNLWTWADAADYSFSQVEEIFSDFVGLALFGVSYLDSFEYLLSPALSTERDPEYPPVAVRVGYLKDNAHRLGVSIPNSYKAAFAAQTSPFDSRRNAYLQMSLADTVSRSLVTFVADHVADLCKSRGIYPPDLLEMDKIIDNFLLGVPAERTSGLGSILNAGWSTLKRPDFMQKYADPDRLKTINELLLKSVEVYEIERITGHGSEKKRT